MSQEKSPFEMTPLEMLRSRRRVDPLKIATISVETYQLAWLKQKANENGTNVSRLVRALLDVAMEDYEIKVSSGGSGKNGKGSA